MKNKITILINFFILELFLSLSIPVLSQKPSITSFSPSPVCQGYAVTIIGTNFTGATKVRLGTLDAANFQVNSATSITAIVADNSNTGIVSVTTTGGTDTANGNITTLPSPIPGLTDVGALDIPFTNCDGNATYTLTVSNSSIPAGGSCDYDIDWGDGSIHFKQTGWPVSNQTTHTYTAQGYFAIKLTITPANGCVRVGNYKFYNGANVLASLTTTTSTTGLCAPATINFQIGNWWNNSSGTIYQLDFGDGTTPLTLTHPLNGTNTDEIVPHVYTTSSCPNVDFKATLKAINGCYTTSYTLDQIIIRKKPIADFNFQPTPACLGTPLCFTNLTTDGYSGTNCNTTSSYIWDFGDGSATSNQQTPPCHTYASSGSYPVTLTASNTTCGSDSKTKTVMVRPTSPPPVVGPNPVYCQGDISVPLTATGTGLQWYTTLTGGTGSPNAPTPPTNVPGTLTYYVSQTITNNCESGRVPISVKINAKPNAPIVNTPVNLCKDQAAVSLTATGTGLLWYSALAGGTGSTTAPTPSTNAIGNTTYYVSQTINGCEGPRASILVSVGPLAGLPIVNSPVIYCQGQTALPLTANGTNLLWYTTASGGTGSAIPPIPITSNVGNIIYYVSQTTGCGEGPRAAITVTVKASPSASIAYGKTILCNVVNSVSNPNPPVNVVVTGSGGGTFSIVPSVGLPIIAPTGTIDPSGAVAGSYIIKYTIPGTGGCSDFITTTGVTVTGTPNASIAYPLICSSDAFVNVQLNGTNGGTFTSSPGLTINSVSGSIAPVTSTPGNYIVTYTIPASSPCPGFVTTANVTITKAPSASITYNFTNLCNVKNTVSTPNPPIKVSQTGTNGGSYSISPSAGLPIEPTSGTITPSEASIGTYTIKYFIAGTGGCSDYNTTTTVTVSATPNASVTYPLMCTSDAIVSANVSGTLGGTFTSSVGLTINNSTGSITPNTSTPGNYTVTYTILPSAPCPGFTTTANITITKAPSALISYPLANVCNVLNTVSTPNPPVDIILSGSKGGTYSISPSTGLTIDASTGTISPSGAVAGTYTVKYSIAAAGGCADFNTTTVVTVNSTPIASITYPGSPYCRAINIPQNTFSSGTPGGSFSSSAGLSINTTTGEIIPSLSSPGVYTITYIIMPSPPCPGFVTTASVEIDDSPVLTFNTSNQSICSGGTAVFIPSSTVANTVYNWSVVGALPVGISGTSSGTSSGANANITLSFTNTVLISESLIIKVIPTNPSQNPCDGSSYNLTLMVNPIPPALITDTANFCMHTPPTALSVNPSPGNTVTWYDENFNLLKSAPVINTTVPNQFIYYASQSNIYSCESPKSKIIAAVHPTAKIISSTYTNPTSCGIASGTIVLNVLDLNNNPIPNIPLIVHYIKFQTAYSISSSTDASGKIIIPLTAGTYSDMYVETYGCTSQKIPDVFVLKDPNPPAQPIVGNNSPICSETALTLSALSPTGTQAGPIDYVWVGPAFGPFADTIKNTVVTFPSAGVNDAGTYIVYAIQNNCISPPVSFPVTIKQSPSKPQILTRTPLCIGDNLSLQGFSSIPGNNLLTYTWSGPGTGFPVNASYAAINNVKIQDGGTYSITVNSPQTGCSSTSDTLIQIGGYPIVKFARDTFTLPTGYLLNLSPSVTNANDPNILPIQKYEWTPSADVSCNDPLCSSPIATIKDNVCYSLKVTNIYGCSGSDTLCVKVFCQEAQVFVPNAFTPHGNIAGNSKFMIRASGIASVKTFRVFDRWGKLVFERDNFSPNDPSFGWDGTVNGKPSDAGVYVYTVEVICENGVPYFKKGNVTLLNN